jgi:hypothetical protein
MIMTMRIYFVLALVAACGGSSDTSTSKTGSGSAKTKAPADAAEPLPVAVGSDGLPLVCGEWKAAIEKLATCTELPQNARDSLIAVYTDASAGWVQLPADAKKKLVEVCRAGADSVLKGAKATCKW